DRRTCLPAVPTPGAASWRRRGRRRAVGLLAARGGVDDRCRRGAGPVGGGRSCRTPAARSTHGRYRRLGAAVSGGGGRRRRVLVGLGPRRGGRSGPGPGF